MSGDPAIAAEGAELDNAIDNDMQEVDKIGEVKALELDNVPEISPFMHLFATIKWLAGVVWLVLVIMLRAHTRRASSIPATCCSCKISGNVDFEDVVCSFFCQPCTLAQMATHTGAISNDSPVRVCLHLFVHMVPVCLWY